MSTVLCVKYGKELPALSTAPFSGEAGEKILKNISAQAWDEWIEMQTMFINENQLNMRDSHARTFLSERRDEFLFEGGEKLDPPEPV